MLKIQEIRELIKLIDKSSINEFEFENEGSKIVLKKNAGAEHVTFEPAAQPFIVQQTPAAAVMQAPTISEAPAAETVSKQADVQDENLHKIVSPMVGTFYASSSPDSDAYVKKGDKVSKDSVVCIVEAMKLFNEIEAEVNGEIVQVLVENGQLVEYGQPLFLVKSE